MVLLLWGGRENSQRSDPCKIVLGYRKARKPIRLGIGMLKAGPGEHVFGYLDLGRTRSCLSPAIPMHLFAGASQDRPCWSKVLSTGLRLLTQLRPQCGEAARSEPVAGQCHCGDCFELGGV